MLAQLPAYPVQTDTPKPQWLDAIAAIASRKAMSQRREIEIRLALFDDLSGILGAMRSYAVAELRRVGKRETAQQHVVLSLGLALADLAEAMPEDRDQQPLAGNDIWLLFGSARGFCGSFNEDVLRFWQTLGAAESSMILLGERLHKMLDNRENIQCVNGPSGYEDAHETIDNILAALAKLRGVHGEPFRLWACFRDEQGARSQKLWPLNIERCGDGGYPPLTHEPPTEIAIGIAEQYLFHSLLALLLRSVRVENHMRLIQMETALRHLAQESEDMQRQRNRLRQEEIVEEIELMICNKH